MLLGLICSAYVEAAAIAGIAATLNMMVGAPLITVVGGYIITALAIVSIFVTFAKTYEMILAYTDFLATERLKQLKSIFREVRIMSERTAEFFEKMQEFLPSVKETYIESIQEYGEVLETVVIEDIFMPLILKLLSENREKQLLENIFKYFEEIVNSDDLHLINVLLITVLEMLGNDKAILETAKQYMGTKTTVLQIKADEELGRI